LLTLGTIVFYEVKSTRASTPLPLAELSSWGRIEFGRCP